MIAAALIGWALTGMAAAAPAPAPSTDIEPVEVITRRARDKLVRTFVRDYTVKSRSDQITRWRQPICPRTLGLPDDALNAFVSQRVREVAASAGAPVRAAETCKANLLIFFTWEPQAFLDRVRSDAPTVLGFHYLHDRKKISRVRYPIQAWYATETEDQNGTKHLDTDDGQIQVAGSASRLVAGTASSLVTALVVVDAKEMIGLNAGTGLDVEPLADYIAVMALSQTESPNRCKPLVSITNLMSADCPAERKPKGLTQSDLAYLKALYAMNTDKFGFLQRSQIALQMGRILDGKEPATVQPRRNRGR